jgi:hypothetical protein
MVAHRQNAVPADVKRYIEAGTSLDNTRTATDLFRRLGQFSPDQWSEALKDYVLHNPLPSGDRWKIVKMSPDEFKVVAETSPILFHSRMLAPSDDGRDTIRTLSVDSTGEKYGTADFVSNRLIEALVVRLDKLTRPKLKTAKGNIPADVERYAEEVRAANPNYDAAKVWATAWSIYCAHKNPDSEHCKKPTDEYFPGRSASDKALRARVIRLAHESRSLRASLLPILSGEDLKTAVSRVLRARVDALAKALGTPEDFFIIEGTASGNILGESGVNITSPSNFKLNVDVTGEMGPTGPKLRVKTYMGADTPEWADEFLKRTMGSSLIGTSVEGTPDVLVQNSDQSAQLHAKFLKPLLVLDQRRVEANDEILTVIKLFVMEAKKALAPVSSPKLKVNWYTSGEQSDGFKNTPSGVPFFITTLQASDVLTPAQSDDPTKVEAVKLKILSALTPLQTSYSSRGIGILLSKKVEYLTAYNIFSVRFMVYLLNAGKPKMKLSASDEADPLRSELIRLAHANPALRQPLLPLLSSRK